MFQGLGMALGKKKKKKSVCIRFHDQPYCFPATLKDIIGFSQSDKKLVPNWTYLLIETYIFFIFGRRIKCHPITTHQRHFKIAPEVL